MGSRDENERRCRRILATAAPLVVDDLAWGRVGEVEVPAEVVGTLRYMRDVEGFTDRDLVGFAGHRTTVGDPVIGLFLDLWRREEAVHSAVLDRWLDTYAGRRGLDVPARQLPPPAEVAGVERVPSRVGGPVGRVVAAAHMAWGAANELLTLHGYRRLGGQTDDPVLPALLTRIAAQESRHYSFYYLQAEWRLGASGLARRALRKVLEGAWTPVGVGDGYKSAAEFAAVVDHLGRDADSRRLLDRMDRRIAALPGFDGLTIDARLAA